ncbi:DNA-binding response regulator, OmpR family, contains REC and winged-helix (wHTH) domain [Aquimarina amphilecti]|uniref:dolichyl-phosphate beta-glucosyltransferase n=1 Tax=Aquimarina amphilecti TaxID=1038014 RepID=A0A1H7G3P0_AQUAM|nr:response regulator [Aquimarina amphilecti]SEK32956.1 DNA-binding response regulator, OmpR family, contains REC and winged-helix (wHTH) domain [Aquimarina amphilecti]
MKRILAIDDQQLILLSLEKHLSDLGYEIKCSDNGKEGLSLFESFSPDLVIVDINMDGMSGLEVIKTIKEEKKSNVKILVLSGNNDEDTIIDGFDMGIDDYMKKPLSLNEVSVRIGRILGIKHERSPSKDSKGKMLQRNCVGVVIPCYNEEKRLLSKEFIDFTNSNLGYHLCFVNDGSTDDTLNVLRELSKGREDNISVYNCEKNGGKGEAVRQGVLHLAQDKQLDYIGYLDADLSTDFKDFDDLVQTISTSDFKIVSGSRMSRMGADITKESARKIISKTINLIIRNILGMSFNDTQCGAKIMDKEVFNELFKEKFITRWLFDVEIFMRMRKFYGKKKAISYICEQPLKRWIHADGSKLSMKDSVKIVGQLGHIAYHYGVKVKSTA